MLDHLLRAAPPTSGVTDVASWFEHLGTCPFDSTFDRALWGGFEADRLGYAFVAGYQAALARLFAMKNTRLSLAATESGGAHPRAIRTRLARESTGLVLRGEKTFATLATAADALLVVATTGESEGRPNLVLVRVPATSPGIVIEGRAFPIAPEIPHAKVTLTDVIVRDEDVLPGDGYTRYLKPFRTIEDIHVLAATLGYLMKVARANDFDRAMVEGLAAQVLALTQASGRDPTDPIGHIALRGIFTTTRDLIAANDREWDKAPEDIRDRWRRDVGLLLVAETARQKRTDAAWQALASSSK